MLIVSDTGPLRYLIEVNAIDVLPRLYGSIATTPDVLRELQLPHFPHPVRTWAVSPPPWLTVESPQNISLLDKLDLGEASAISLALENHADAILIDERDGTVIARSLGLQAFATLAVLQAAGHAGHLDFLTAIEQLTTQTQFRHSRKLIAEIIAAYKSPRPKRPPP